ncbi:hypothetical protein [Uliginosibacterium gangwonense]|nr:hypothetical protein [Uliginosibacterium gangwonense]
MPAHLFKLVYDQAENKAWAYRIGNTNESQASKPISDQDLTKRLGVEL